MFSLHAVNRGRVIHRILQEIPGLPREQGMALARRLLAKNQLSQELAHGIMKVIASPESEAFFAADSQAEVSIGAILPSGDRLTGTIDRLAMRGSEIWILDYKTDWSPPTELSPDHPHVRQVAAYALALSQAYPQKTVKAALLWTSTARLDWIPHDILERAISDIAAVTSQYAVRLVELE
jgi:ATP-dependent helicase/nuclease subunit A